MIHAPYPRLAAALVLLAPVLAGCGQGQPPGGGAPPPPTVTVAKPVERGVIDQDEYVGRFVAVDSVEVRARVSGYLDQIHFRDGQMVKQGDLLFTIDKRPFQNTVAQTRGTLAQAKANLAFTEADLERAKQLVRDSTITEQTFDQRTQANRGAQASVAANEAAVQQAELDLEFTELRAPVAGRIGDRRVSPGNLVTGGTGGNTTMLATIVSLDPIRFEFTIDEASYLRYERFAGSGKEVTAATAASTSRSSCSTRRSSSTRGNMDFVDNAIDRSSGTIRGRAVFSNPDSVLTPGMFGRIRVPGSPPYTALLVPDAAIGTEQVAQVRAGGRRRQRRGAEIRHARPADRRQASRHQGRHHGRRPRHRQRPDARAAGPEGHAAGAGAPPPRPAGQAGQDQAQRRDPAHADFAFLHRPADLRRRGLDRHRDPRRGRVRASAGRAISGDRAAGHQRLRPVSRRQRRGRRLDRGRADRGADQRRREHALHVVELDRRRALLDRASPSISAPISTSRRCRCRTASRSRCRGCRPTCATSASPSPRPRPT